MDDSIVGKNPCQAGSIRRPKVIPKRAVPWTLELVEAVSGELPDSLTALPFLGAGCVKVSCLESGSMTWTSRSRRPR
ncbi:MAG TPA: hypothetical protein VFQ15_10975 [Jiangellaceae bacterium]|nr:hypothetical protein [Jiangellaceae bacterium]